MLLCIPGTRLPHFSEARQQAELHIISLPGYSGMYSIHVILAQSFLAMLYCSIGRLIHIAMRMTNIVMDGSDTIYFFASVKFLY